MIDPTLAAFDFIRQRPGQLSQAYAAVADHMPPDVRRSLQRGRDEHPERRQGGACYEKSYQKCIEFVGRMYRAGIPLVAGTDATPGFTLQRELELYVQAGLTPAQVLQIATWNGAKYSRVLAERGSITPGKVADLVLVDGDPTRDISTIRKVAMVLKGDKAYYPSEVYTELGVKPFRRAAAVHGAGGGEVGPGPGLAAGPRWSKGSTGRRPVPLGCGAWLGEHCSGSGPRSAAGTCRAWRPITLPAPGCWRRRAACCSTPSTLPTTRAT